VTMAATVPVRRVEAPKPSRHPAARDRREHAAAPKRTLPKPDLRLVPRPRVAYNAALVLAFVVVVLMLGTVVLHTRLAERQGDIDRLETAVTDAREQFDVLRQQRAELRSPTRLAIEARDHGMVPTPRTEFLPIDPQTLAEVVAAAGVVDDVTGVITTEDPLDQIRRVKAADGGGR
jgi:cell division protein FtsL